MDSKLFSSALVLVCAILHPSRGQSVLCPLGILSTNISNIGLPSLSIPPENIAQYVTFYLYTNQNPTTPQILTVNNSDSVVQSYYNSSYPTAITIHGWTGNYTNLVTTLIKSALFSVGNFNIIAVDWSPLAGQAYPSAVSYARSVGPIIAQFVDFLVSSGLLSLDKVHCIGHSMGAHVCGFAGKHLKSGHFRIISGLDAAGPWYENVPSPERLDAGDAYFVQTIHTSACSYGIVKAIGHIDFYPDGGQSQPACGSDNFCSHRIVNNYFAEAIKNSTVFRATGCTSYAGIILTDICYPNGLVTYITDRPQPPSLYGVYSLNVSRSPPYGIGIP